MSFQTRENKFWTLKCGIFITWQRCISSANDAFVHFASYYWLKKFISRHYVFFAHLAIGQMSYCHNLASVVVVTNFYTHPLKLQNEFGWNLRWLFLRESCTKRPFSFLFLKKNMATVTKDRTLGSDSRFMHISPKPLGLTKFWFG